MIWKVFEFADVKVKVNKLSTIFTFGGILVSTFAGKLTSHKHKGLIVLISFKCRVIIIK